VSSERSWNADAETSFRSVSAMSSAGRLPDRAVRPFSVFWLWRSPLRRRPESVTLPSRCWYGGSSTEIEKTERIAAGGQERFVVAEYGLDHAVQ
jgi:hypothetical protein